MLPPQILIVDADASARAALRTLLDEHAGLPVAAECGTLSEARQVLVRRTIHLVFLELDLPGEDGLALLPCIPPTARVVVLTAPDRGLVRDFPGDPANHLIKPVAAAPLAAALRLAYRTRSAPPLATVSP